MVENLDYRSKTGSRLSLETSMDSSVTLEPVSVTLETVGRKIIQPIPEYMFERVGI
jgi:hypothetical protein